ncbi:GTP-binding protein RAD-like, partial [Diaphorina citri]|uniref:GTP-binding protein RAD-like n=1 Tax=Diaphorina citri TaxID=121845 RepID=A0A1S4EQM1_DIACI
MDPSGQSVSIVLNGEESELRFIKSTSTKFDFRQSSGGVPDAFVLVYSVIDKPSYHRVEQDVIRLHEEGYLRTRPAIIVANKIDLARARAVSSQ